MKISPFQLYVKSLAYGPVRLGLLEKEVAYERLKKLTSEDFGYDVEKWKTWGIEHPEISEGPFSHIAKREAESEASHAETKLPPEKS